jgi:GNAT superfamily N-acetyltransferase
MENEFKLEVYKGSAIEEVAGVVAAAMLHNPLHLAVFGASDEKSKKRQTGLFQEVLRQPECHLHVAYKGSEMIGLMNYYLAGHCQIGALKTVRLLPRLALLLGPKLFRVLKWKRAWGRHDPRQPHLHFGPLAVLAPYQGQGVGSALLHRFCQIADAQQLGSYLETDKEENVVLYQKFGFRVVSTDTLLGVKNWFMWRDARQLEG